MYNKYIVALKRISFALLLIFILGCSDDAAKGGEKDEMIIGKLEMVTIEGSTFISGQWLNQPRSVTISTFGLAKHEVTRELWYAVMGDEYFQDWEVDYINACPTCPVEAIHAPDVLVFFEKLNALTGKKYRLPTEMEWEFAYRGGALSNNYVFSGGNNADAVAWYSANANQVQSVGTKQPNELGIYDMEGNVSELCSDYTGVHAGNVVISPQFKNPTGAIYGNYKIRKGSSVSCWLLQDGLGRDYLNCSFDGQSSLVYGAATSSYDPNENTNSPVGFRIAEQLMDEPEIKLGQTYQGGMVVYIDATGQHGLIMAGLEAVQGGYEFSCPQLLSATSSENGLINSETLANACPGTAAAYCLALTHEGYSDWYLPSIQELLKIHYNLGVTAFHPETVLYSMTSTTGSSSPFFQHQYLASGISGNANIEYMGGTGATFRPIRAF